MVTLDRKKPNPIRSLVITIVVITIIITLGIFLLPYITTQIGLAPSGNVVVYKVEGSAEQAVVTYIGADGRISTPKGVDIPWTSPSLTIKSGTIVVLTAAAIDNGKVKCTIYVGGRVVDTNFEDPFVDKAICGAVIK